MSPGLFEQRYGFGAGRVPLCPAPHRWRDVRSFRELLLEARRDGDSPGPSLAQIAKASPAFVAAALLLAFVFANLLRLPPDESVIRIVAFVEPIVELLPKLPPPDEPELEPVPVERAKPEPVRSVDALAGLALPPPTAAEPLPPKPPAPTAAKPLPPRPQIQQIAPAPEPPPAPLAPRRVSRDPRAKPAAAPRLRFDPLKASDLDAPPRPTRAARFSAARPTDAKPSLDAPALHAAPAAQAPPPTRSARSAPERSRRLVPQLAMARASPALPSNRPPPRRESRRAPALPAPRRSTRSKLALALPDTGPEPQAPSRPAAVRPRAERPAPAPATRPRSDEPAVRGVPLGSLAACVSDRLEDTLKQKVVAAARDRTHCEGAGGRYHFIETKNVNAFLMGIERALQRKPGDRCAELTHALDCLSRLER